MTNLQKKAIQVADDRSMVNLLLPIPLILVLAFAVVCLISGARTWTQVQAATAAGWQRWCNGFRPDWCGPNAEAVLSEARQFELWNSGKDYSIGDVGASLRNLDAMYQRVSNGNLDYAAKVSFLSTLEVDREWLVDTLNTMKLDEATRKAAQGQ